MASVLAGASALFVVLGAVFNLVLVAAALPFGLAAYLLWLHATGRLAERVRRRTVPSGREGSNGRRRRSARRRTAAGERSTARWPTDERPPPMDRRTALEVLDLPRGADQQAIRRAYREQVKAVHPDAEGGDEDAFRRVTAAYEQLRHR